MTPHPARFEADFVEHRSRLTTFFRWLLVLPHAIVLWLWSIAAAVAVIAAWFALVLTERYPRSLYDFVAGFVRYMTYVSGYVNLLTDRYPPFTGDSDARYPVRLLIGPPLERYSRLKAGLRIVLAIPVLLIAYAMQVVAQVGAFLAWFAIVALGRQPAGLQNMIALGLSYQERAYAYVLLLDEGWPPFTDEHARALTAEPSGPTLPPDSSVTPS
jgi:hypothetical protein